MGGRGGGSLGSGTITIHGSFQMPYEWFPILQELICFIYTIEKNG